MKLDKYIYILLTENDTVIVPGFGAFLSSYKPAEINNETQEIIPPSKTISFNQNIRNNDGMLVGMVAEKEQISHFDALKSIEKERDNLIYLLDKGEKVNLENIGILFTDEARTVVLKPINQENLLIDSFGLDKTSLVFAEAEDKKTEAEVEKPEENALVEEKENNIVSGEEIGEQQTEIEQEEIEQQNEETAIVPPVEIVSAENVSEEEKALEKENKMVAETDNKVEVAEKKKRKGLWLLIFIPIIVAGYYVIQQQEKPAKTQTPPQKTETQEPEKPEENTNIIISDSLVTDTLKAIIDTTVQQEIQEDNNSELVEEGPRYILVGGSFKDESNAEKYVEQLKADGYQPFHLGKRGSFYIVGIGKYNSFEEADKAKEIYTGKNPGSGVWVKKE